MRETGYPHAPHGFLAEICVDFRGLDVQAGTEIFLRIANWVEDKKCSALIPPLLIETSAFLYHIVFGCGEKLKTITCADEHRAWQKILNTYSDMAYRSWQQIWQTAVESSVNNCGGSAADEIVLLFGEYDKTLLVSAKRKKKQQPTCSLELSDLPDWRG